MQIQGRKVTQHYIAVQRQPDADNLLGTGHHSVRRWPDWSWRRAWWNGMDGVACIRKSLDWSGSSPWWLNLASDNSVCKLETQWLRLVRPLYWYASARFSHGRPKFRCLDQRAGACIRNNLLVVGQCIFIESQISYSLAYCLNSQVCALASIRRCEERDPDDAQWPSPHRVRPHLSETICGSGLAHLFWASEQPATLAVDGQALLRSMCYRNGQLLVFSRYAQLWNHAFVFQQRDNHDLRVWLGGSWCTTPVNLWKCIHKDQWVLIESIGHAGFEPGATRSFLQQLVQCATTLHCQNGQQSNWWLNSTCLCHASNLGLPEIPKSDGRRPICAPWTHCNRWA